jgi:hypothetical protein
VPRGAAPRLGYQLAMAAFWPRETKGEPAAEEIPLLSFGVKPGTPVPPGAATRLQGPALRAAKDHGDAKPDWIVAIRTTLAKAMAAVSPGDSMPAVNPGTPVYLVVTKGDFTTAGHTAVTGHYLSAIIDARTFLGYDSGLLKQAPSVPLTSLGPLTSLAGGQPAAS